MIAPTREPVSATTSQLWNHWATKPHKPLTTLELAALRWRKRRNQWLSLSSEKVLHGPEMIAGSLSSDGARLCPISLSNSSIGSANSANRLLQGKSCQENHLASLSIGRLQ